MPDENTEKQSEAKARQTAGLIPFKPGQSGNPAGRPKKPVCISSQLRDLIEGQPIKLFEQWKKKERELTGAQIIAMSMFAQMKKGNHHLVKEALDRLEGKVTQPISGPDDGPIEVSITDARRRLTERISTIAAVREAERIAGGTD